ncbi:ligase [Arthrobacter psychrolactophilus]|uniref:Ligase n=1 Tax=Arthrobacter psychrolactophilus TaxID=92442 RepID=A0A2V5JDK4_9MICC|nr:O-antigen ligase family protein [Arthrobacter psychrolactophilus]PYI37317.1 ligase [Arthrobacter psychrolactophilus]
MNAKSFGTVPGARAQIRHTPPLSPTDSGLPAWPMLVLLAGFPVWWAFGAAPFAPIGLAAIMLALLVCRGNVTLVPGLLPWFAFLAWACVAAINLPDGGTALGYAQRLGNLMAVGVYMVYYVNARRSLPAQKVMTGIGVVWLTVVVLGLLAMMWPEYRLLTPIGKILPGGLLKNPLVYDLVFPPLAEIQQPWGAPEPFNRPAAPFPYANSWGVAFALLTPCAVYLLLQARRWWVKIGILAVIALSFLPALATSNRGMLLGLAVGTAYVLLRVAARGQLIKVAGLGLAIAGVVGALLISGALGDILGRQQYSDSTSGRLSIYDATLAAVLNSPWVGYGAPRMDATIGISLGTQGYIWMLMFSFGFVGLGLFLLFLGNGIIRTWSAPGTTGLWLHGVLITTVAIIPYYSLDIMQMSVVGLTMTVLLRARAYGENLERSA